MAVTRHVYVVYVKAPVETVWNAVLDPAFTRRYFHSLAFREPPVAGQPYAMASAAGEPGIDGVVEVLEPPHRLVQTWRGHFAPGLAEEQPSRVEWNLSVVGDGLTRVELVHGDLAASPATWAAVKEGWVYVLDGLKSVVETGDGLPPTDRPVPVDEDPVSSWHRQSGVEANNSVWEILGDDGRRSIEDLEEMTRRAYASAYHWDRAAGRGPVNAARADWMLARVWAVRGNADLALHHADRCMATCVEHGLVDFDLAYAYEARARALACAGRHDEARADRAAASAVPIADPEDEVVVVDDIAAEPWFGLSIDG